MENPLEEVADVMRTSSGEGISVKASSGDARRSSRLLDAVVEEDDDGGGMGVALLERVVVVEVEDAEAFFFDVETSRD